MRFKRILWLNTYPKFMSVGVLLVLFTLPSFGQAASFDCAKASNNAEKTICSVQAIGALDSELAVAYKQAGSAYRDSQRAWIKQRNKCGADANCLSREYQTRLAYLRGEVSNAAGGNTQSTSNSISAETRSEIETSRRQITNALNGSKLIIIASMKAEAEAISFVNNFYQEKNLTKEDLDITVFLSDNEWFGISIGDVVENQCPQTVDNLKSQGLIPTDSFCSDAKAYIAAFKVENDQFQIIAGRNYFSDKAKTAAVASNENDVNKIDLTILAKKREFEVYKKLDGSFSVSAIKSSGRNQDGFGFCVVANRELNLGLNLLGGNSGYRDQLIDTLNVAVKELFVVNSYSLNGNDIEADKFPSCVVFNGEIGSNEEAELVVISTADLGKLEWRSGRWAEIGRIDHASIVRIQAELSADKNKEANRLSALGSEYSELADKKSQEKIGAINLSYPETNESLNVCTLSVKGDESIPYVEYLKFESGNLFTLNLRKAAIKSRNGEMSLSKGYSRKFDSLDQFYGYWQNSVNSADRCNSFVGYPADIVAFVNGAKSISPDFVVELNDLVATASLFENRAISKGFDNWEQLLFAREAQATKFGIDQLANFGIKSVTDWQALLQEIKAANYANSADINAALQYLEDKKLGLESNSSPIQIREQRLQAEKAEADRIAKRKAAQIRAAAEKRAENLKNGEATFKHYSDDSCKDNEEYSSYCVTKSEFNSLCEKVGYYYTSIIPQSLLFERQLYQLYQNNKDSISSIDPAYITQGGDCYFKYNISGMIDGTNLSKDMYCRVISIEGRSGDFYTEGVLDCRAR